MGGQADKPKTVTVDHSETNGFKEEDRSWSIINIHLSCAINRVLSLCAVIFVLCLLAFIIHRIVRRYCKKRHAAKERQHRIQMLLFHLPTQPFGQKQNDQRNDFAFADHYRFPVHNNGSTRFTDYSEPPSRATLHQLLQGLAPAAPTAAVSPPPLPAVLPPATPGTGQLNHPIPA
jgi:hypothetical protein